MGYDGISKQQWDIIWRLCPQSYVTFDTFHWKHDDQPLYCQGHVSFRQTLDPSIGGTACATQQLPPDL